MGMFNTTGSHAGSERKPGAMDKLRRMNLMMLMKSNVVIGGLFIQ